MSFYRIRIKGRLSDRFAQAFRGMRLVPEPNQTALLGIIEDQAHLFGILDRIRSLGLELVSVEPDSEGPDSFGAPADRQDALSPRPAASAPT